MTSEIRTNSLKSRAGLSTVTLTDSGPMFSGITTFVDNSTFSVGTGGTIHAPATNVMALGTNSIDAIKIDSSGNVNVTGILTASSFSGGVSLANGADNRVVTATGASVLTGEQYFTWNGNNLALRGGQNQNCTIELASDQGDSAADFWRVMAQNSDNALAIDHYGSGSWAEKFRITSGGQVNIGGDYTQTSYNLSVTNTGGNLFRIKTANEGDYDLRFMIQNSESNIWHYGTDDLTFGARYDRKLSLITNGAKRLTVNGDLIGINNSSPAKNLHVTSSGVATLRIETTDSRGQAWDLLSTNGASSNTGTLSFRDESGSAYLEFGANGGSPKLQMNLGGASAHFVVDNNGRVTKPNQPSFHVYTVSGSQSQVLTFSNTHHNNGSHMNAGTGTFTCPVDGRYLFSFAFLHNTGPTTYARVLFQLNGSRNTNLGDTLCDDTGLYINTSMTMVFNLSQNDTVQLYNEGNNIYGSQYGAFSGCLLY